MPVHADIREDAGWIAQLESSAEVSVLQKEATCLCLNPILEGSCLERLGIRV